MKEIRFTVPDEWHDELTAAASLQAISLSDLMRLVCRRFLRNRYSDLEQEALR